MAKPRVAFFCMPSIVAVRALAELTTLADVRYLISPLGPEHKRRAIISVQCEDRGVVDPVHLARRAGIDCFLVGDASADPAVDLYRSRPVDLVVIAFFNQLLRPRALDALGAVVNLHPSLLPQLRGPAPLFWTYKDGHARSGLTMHRVTPGEDDGPVTFQAPIDVAFGQRAESVVDEIGHLAPLALRAFFTDLSLPGAPQAHERATRAPRPNLRARTIDHEADLEDTFHLVRGGGRLHGLVINDGNEGLEVRDATRFAHGVVPPADLVVHGREAIVRVGDGALYCPL